MDQHADACERMLASGDTRYLVYSSNPGPNSTGDFEAGGLCDRLKGIASCYLLAMATQRILVVDWDRPFDILQNVQPGDVDWRMSRHAPDIGPLSQARHMDFTWPGGKDLVFIPPMKLERRLFKNKRVCIVNQNIFRYRKHTRYFSLPEGLEGAFSIVFERLFRIVVPAHLEGEMARIERARETHDGFFAVHMRTGDLGERDDDPPYEFDRWEAYTQAMERAFEVAAEHGSKNPVFYFASDSKRARTAVAEADWPFSVLTVDGDIGHIDRPGEANQQTNDFAFFEFEVMRRSDRCIGGAGGFSRTASWAQGRDYIRYDEPPNSSGEVAARPMLRRVRSRVSQAARED